MNGFRIDDPFHAAATEIASRDPAMRRAVTEIGPPDLRPPLDGYFAALVRAITFQQLAGAAARAIHARVLATMPDGPDPRALLAVPEADLRAAGLSGAKTASVRDLAARIIDGTIPVDGLERHTDEDIIARLSSVRGIGRWTAEMFLIFQLRRIDVWPVDDLGVRRGFARIHTMPGLPGRREMSAAAERYRPYRSVVAWYCWRAVERPEPRAS